MEGKQHVGGCSEQHAGGLRTIVGSIMSGEQLHMGGCSECHGQAHSHVTKAAAVGAGGGVGCSDDHRQHRRAIVYDCSEPRETTGRRQTARVATAIGERCVTPRMRVMVRCVNASTHAAMGAAR